MGMTKDEALKAALAGLVKASRYGFGEFEEEKSAISSAIQHLEMAEQPALPLGDSNPGLQWDKTPQAFNDWWDSDYDPTGNPYRKDSAAYWAWAGWKAATEQPSQQHIEHCIWARNGHQPCPHVQPAQPSKPLPEDYTALEQALTRLQKRYAELEGKASKPWVSLTDEEIDEGQRQSWVEKQAFESAVWWAEAKLKEKNT